MRELRLIVLDGLTKYDDTHALQLKTVDELKSGRESNTLIIAEHYPVITLGRNADPAGVLVSEKYLADSGVDIRRVERGGQVTYHGPGQIVGYPILDIRKLKISVKTFVSNLERTMMIAARKMGIDTFLKTKAVGVFSAKGKLGAVGVRVTQGITFHGFAFNVCPDLSHYKLIVPCGITDTAVTSILEIKGSIPSNPEAKDIVIDSFCEAFNISAKTRTFK